VSPNFAPWSALAGGALIGLAASVMLLVEGRVAGISGIVGGLATPRAGDIGWRVAFALGLATAGALAVVAAPELVAVEVSRPAWMLVVAGVLVGFGTRLGNGCTSGHGVCGLARGSSRSLASVVTFMTFGAGAAALAGLFGGGR
jgi:hypothetical protein